MDLDDEWELLSVGGSLGLVEDADDGKRGGHPGKRSCYYSSGVVRPDHFRCPSPPGRRLVPVVPMAEEEIRDCHPSGKSKVRENQFVDMKLGEAEAEMEAVARDREAASAGAAKTRSERQENDAGPEVIVGEERERSEREDERVMKRKESVSIWKRGLTGIGALCSFGVAAAATFCVIVLGSNINNKQEQHKHNIRFQIYTDDKRIKKVVHHATKLNEAISAVSGVPRTRAHIIVGGYYDGL